MGNFLGGMFDPTREGPGVSKDGPQKKRFFLFFDIYFRKFTKILLLLPNTAVISNFIIVQLNNRKHIRFYSYEFLIYTTNEKGILCYENLFKCN